MGQGSTDVPLRSSDVPTGRSDSPFVPASCRPGSSSSSVLLAGVLKRYDAVLGAAEEEVPPE